MTLIILFFTIFMTSLLSGILGMGGGFILAGVLGLILPLPAALFIHAVTQFTANTYRASLHWKHIQIRIVKNYVIGMTVTVALFSLGSVMIDKPLFYLLLGTIAISSHFVPKRLTLDATKTTHSVAMGLLVSALHLFVGVAGPLLDVFFQRTSLNRFQIVATKSATQALGHLVRILFYLSLYIEFQINETITSWVVAGAVALAIVGTYAGSLLLTRINEKQFQRFSRYLLNVLGILFIVKGASGLLG
jgi:uncharacterized membrane protein YfcA